MAISAESTSSKILITIVDNPEKEFILQRAYYKDDKWLTWTGSGFADLEESTEEEPIEPLAIKPGDFVDYFSLNDGLFEYRYVDKTKENPTEKDYVYSQWVKFGTPDAIGYSFNNYHPANGSWGTIITPDDIRYTYMWGTDLKATNGTYFKDEQLQFLIDAALKEVERLLNITIRKRVYKSTDSINGLTKGIDYDEEEAFYDFTTRKIQRYGMIETRHRPLLNVTKCQLLKRGGTNVDLLDSVVLDKKKGLIKFLRRPYISDSTYRGISKSLCTYGDETFQPHLFYSIDYSAGYENSDEVPEDLRQIIAKVAAIGTLNIIGDGLMSGFSSSSLSMDGISESFSSTQSATSGFFGSRIMQYQKEVDAYFEKNKFRFGYMPIGTL